MHWAKINKSLIKFQNVTTIKTFEYLFGKQAEKLWNHFTTDCKRQFMIFYDLFNKRTEKRIDGELP